MIQPFSVFSCNCPGTVIAADGDNDSCLILFLSGSFVISQILKLMQKYNKL